MYGKQWITAMDKLLRQRGEENLIWTVVSPDGQLPWTQVRSHARWSSHWILPPQSTMEHRLIDLGLIASAKIRIRSSLLNCTLKVLQLRELPINPYRKIMETESRDYRIDKSIMLEMQFKFQQRLVLHVTCICDQMLDQEWMSRSSAYRSTTIITGYSIEWQRCWHWPYIAQW